MKITKTVLAIICCIAFSLSFSANAIVESEFYYQEKDITVIFDTESVLSTEQKQFVADKIVSGEPLIDDGSSTYSLCWLTGHDIISESVTVVEHKVRAEVPRCLRNIYFRLRRLHQFLGKIGITFDRESFNRYIPEEYRGMRIDRQK